MNMSPQINELATALSKAQAEMRGAQKDATNVFFKTSYSTLAGVVDAIREPFGKNGLSYVQIVKNVDLGEMILVTMLMYASGQWLSSEYPIRPVKSDPQGVGSAVTYARRYSLQAIAGVPSVDDDGEATMGRTAAPIQKPVTQIQRPQPQQVVKPAVNQSQKQPAPRSTFDEMDAPPDYMR